MSIESAGIENAGRTTRRTGRALLPIGLLRAGPTGLATALLAAAVLASACGPLGAGESEEGDSADNTAEVAADNTAEVAVDDTADDAAEVAADNFAEAAADHTAEVAAGTSLVIRLDQPVSTRSTSVGSAISGSIVEPVVYDGAVLIPAASRVRGVVTAISKDPPLLSASFTEIEVGGEPHALEATLSGARMNVRSEMKDEAAKIGGGAAAGAVLGGVIGGNVKGAAIGAAAGAAAGTGVALATKESWAFLPAGSQVAVRLEGSLRLQLARDSDPTH